MVVDVIATEVERPESFGYSLSVEESGKRCVKYCSFCPRTRILLQEETEVTEVIDLRICRSTGSGPERKSKEVDSGFGISASRGALRTARFGHFRVFEIRICFGVSSIRISNFPAAMIGAWDLGFPP